MKKMNHAISFFSLSALLCVLPSCVGGNGAGGGGGWSLKSSFRASRNLKDSSQDQAQAWLDGNPNLGSVAEIRQAQQLSMATFYYATLGPTAWTDRTNWLSYSVNECQWFNFAEEDACDDSNNLIELDLESNGLQGTLPTTIGAMSFLQTLDLEDNNITGTLPTQIGSLSNLQTLDLGTNLMTGEIPTELGELESIQEIELKENNFTSSIPKELGNLGATLELLDLSECLLEGTIPSELTNLNALEVLILSDNKELDGEIPVGLFTMPNLLELELDGNYFTGTVPSIIGMNTRLALLKLDDCLLSGTIPTEIANVSTLVELDLGDNDLVGTIPSQLSRLTNLKVRLCWSQSALIGRSKVEYQHKTQSSLFV
jgi:Leucine-rich repeat (LRR) protein